MVKFVSILKKISLGSAALLGLLTCTGFLYQSISANLEEDKQKSVNHNVTVSNGELYFESTGEGEPLIFIHAGFSDHRDWKYQIED